MNQRILPFVLLSALGGSTLASEPGQPLDCSDWVFLEPGLSCVPFAAFGTLDWNSPFALSGSNLALDNEGSMYVVRVKAIFGGPLNDANSLRTEIVRMRDTGEDVIAYVGDRDGAPGRADWLRPTSSACSGAGDSCPYYGSIRLAQLLAFDAVRGRLLLPLRSFCSGVGCTYTDGRWIASIQGFATLLEIQQSYVPTATGWAFRVPAHPEGLQAADHFDTYYGPLTQPIDFTQAQPLQCGFPASPPSAGDYLTVADSLPNPASGTGRYYVTAVTHQGQRRYGRQSIGGVMSGRYPALLPSCQE